MPVSFVAESLFPAFWCSLKTKLQLWGSPRPPPPLFFSFLFLGWAGGLCDCSSVRRTQCCQGRSPGLFTGVFLLDLLSKGEGIPADTLPSESPLGCVETLVFFSGSFTLAVGSTPAQMSKHTQMSVRNPSDEGEDRKKPGTFFFFFVCFYVLIRFFETGEGRFKLGIVVGMWNPVWSLSPRLGAQTPPDNCLARSLEQEGTGEIASVTQGTSNCYLLFLRPLPGDLVLRWAGEVGSWEASRYL